jgi:hypothetical protein
MEPDQVVRANRPPITEGQLVLLFWQHCGQLRQEQRADTLTAAKLLNLIVGEALDLAGKDLAGQVDSDTDDQLSHVLNAVKRMAFDLNPGEEASARSLRAFDPVAGQKEPAPGPATAGRRGIMDLITRKRSSQPTTPDVIEGPPPPDGPDDPDDSDDPDVLAVVLDALASVEKAFSKRPEPRLIPGPPWYEGRSGLFEAIRDVIQVAEEQPADRVRESVLRLQGALAQQGIQALRYQPGLTDKRQEEQAGAFGLAEHASGDGGQYVTVKRALVVQDSDGNQVAVLAPGKASLEEAPEDAR